MPGLPLDDDKRGMLFLVLSGVSLVVSFFDIGGLPMDAAWLAVLLCGVPIVKGAAEALVAELDIKADLLVSLALVASVIVGEIFAAGEIAFIMTIGAMLEERTVAKARAGIEKLVRLTPRTARVVRGSSEEIVAAEDVRVGDVLRVLAGETIAVDGVLLAGRSAVDQSLMTGESLPVDKEAGDEVFSGTVNQHGAFEMRATKVGEDSSLQRMIRLVESADADKAEIVGTADRWATWIVVGALLSAGATWFVTGEMLRAVTILVVFCPCALVLATPTAIMAGIGNATRFGILVREGDALERLARVARVAFDKTGTLTSGKPSVAAVESLSPDLSNVELLRLTAIAERRSEHPLGRAIVAEACARIGGGVGEPLSFEMVAGRGVAACVEGRSVLAGSAGFFAERGVEISEAVREAAERSRSEGGTVIFSAVDGRAAGFVTLADEVRPEAADVLRRIRESGVRPALLTGDNARAAAHVARALGIEDVYADCLPEAKLRILSSWRDEGALSCMVGDGVNDAPALKLAHVGVAMGGIGSDIAIDAADIVLVGDDIRNLPHLLRLAKRTMRTIHINLSLSLLLNFAAIGLAMTGVLTPVTGALVHNLGSVAVIVHSALLLRWDGGDAVRAPSAPRAAGGDLPCLNN